VSETENRSVWRPTAFHRLALDAKSGLARFGELDCVTGQVYQDLAQTILVALSAR
jgi:hypothetical protein